MKQGGCENIRPRNDTKNFYVRVVVSVVSSLGQDSLVIRKIPAPLVFTLPREVRGVFQSWKVDVTAVECEREEGCDG